MSNLARREHTRTELLLAAAILVLAALSFRYAWLPHNPEAVLKDAADTWGLPVEDTARWFSNWALGDGQAYAIIATDPLALQETELGFVGYRYGRAGFGWLAWVASLGQAEWVPYGLAVVGALSLLGLFLLSWRLRPKLGARAWIIVLNPAVMVAFATDTAEGLGLLLLTLAIASNSKWASAALGLVRPSYLVAVARRPYLLASGLASAATLWVVMSLRFGIELTPYGNALDLPLTGYLAQPSFGAAVIGVAGLWTLYRGVRQRDLSWVAAGLLVLCFSSIVLEDASNGWRAAGMIFVLWAFGPRYGDDELGQSMEDSGRQLRVSDGG